jgi:hypothetical protein
MSLFDAFGLSTPFVYISINRILPRVCEVKWVFWQTRETIETSASLLGNDPVNASQYWVEKKQTAWIRRLRAHQRQDPDQTE